MNTAARQHSACATLAGMDESSPQKEAAVVGQAIPEDAANGPGMS